MKPARLMLFLLGAAALPAVHAAPLATETILVNLPVDAEGDRNVFAIPFDYREGMLFTVHVEPPAGTGAGPGKEGMNLRTVIRKGQRQPDGSWRWQEKLIEPRTIFDPWHTQASIALDKLGHVHVAYNMHNMPWQYAVSSKPYDIEEFQFRGQPVSEDELAAVKFRNKTPFPELGSAAIPGNQITYPMFFSSRDGELYLTYRYALKPARSWSRRAFAGAIARYDAERKIWRQLGGPLTIDRDDARLPGAATTATQQPFAFEDGHSVYLITLGFDRDNGLHAFWNWRPGGAGMETIKPSYAWSRDQRTFLRSDGAEYPLPIGFRMAEAVAGSRDARQYYAPKSVAVMNDGSPLVILHPLEGGRQIFSYDRNKQRFTAEPAPASASEIVVDREGRQWAFASGLRVFMRNRRDSAWEEIGQLGKELCYPKVRYIAGESRFVVHAKSCKSNLVGIYSFRR